MALLELVDICKSWDRDGGRAALSGVSLDLDGGELVGIWGIHGSGRSTLLRIAAGIDIPDGGVVRFAGQGLQASSTTGLGNGIAYCRKAFARSEGHSVLDQLISGQEALGIRGIRAAALACEALRQVNADSCTNLRLDQLDRADALRVALARALALRPRVLVVDEPTLGLEARDRDSVLELLRAQVTGGLAVLMSTGEIPCLAAADRALTLGGGVLRGEVVPRIAPVVPFRRPRAQPAA